MFAVIVASGFEILCSVAYASAEGSVEVIRLRRVFGVVDGNCCLIDLMIRIFEGMGGEDFQDVGLRA